MTYAELVTSLARSCRLQKNHINRVLRNLALTVPAAVKDGKALRYPKLGTFKLATRKGRTIRNPQTKALMHLPASTTLAFKAAAVARKRASR